ncbi:MAG: 4Fe-4S binding protein [Acidobacteria bacterium]|nr:4Fe-4S binding protein [Acidobacteriota bacterium]
MNVESAQLHRNVFPATTRLTRVMKHALFPGVFQWLVVAMVLFTAYAALFTTSVPERNFALVFVWIFWGTVAPISIWLFGRYWCAVCPFQLLGSFLSKIRGQEKSPPRWIRQYALVVALVLFIVIIWFEHAVDIFKSPVLTLLLLVPVLIGTVVGALLYRNVEFWCRGFCPILPLARNYSMMSLVEVRAAKDACEGCEVKSCYRGQEQVSGCPVGLYLRSLDNMQDCIACGQCVKACETQGALSFRFRGFLDEFRRIQLPRLDGAVFAGMWPGILAIHFFTLHPAGDRAVRSWMEALGISSYVAMWTLLYSAAIAVSLLLVAAGTWLSAKIAGQAFSRGFAYYSYAFIPLAVGIHTAFNMPRFFGEQGLNRVAHTLLDIFGYSLGGAVMVLNSNAVYFLMFALLGAGLIASLIVLRHMAAPERKSWPALAPLAATMGVFAFVAGSIFYELY